MMWPTLWLLSGIARVSGTFHLSEVIYKFMKNGIYMFSRLFGRSLDEACGRC